MSSLPDEMLECRPLLRAHCYRMLGHPQDADDAVQETFLRAVRFGDGFEGRATARTWLVKVATRVCLDALGERKRRRMPTEVPPGSPQGPFVPTEAGEWVAPIPEAWLPSPLSPPDDQVALRSRVDLALITLLQKLPPRQRAALLLADVFDCSASEVAQILEWTPAGVNSALQRARSRLGQGLPPRSQADPALVARYREAFVRYDLDALVALLSEDVVFDMPPMPLWLRGRDDVAAFLRGPGAECEGSRVVPVVGNGLHGYAQYRHHGRTPWALVLLQTREGRVVEVHNFLETSSLFPLFGLPMRLDSEESAMRFGALSGL